MQSETSVLLPQSLLPTPPTRGSTTRAPNRPAASRCAHQLHHGTSRQRYRLRVPGATLAAFLVGLATTLYIAIGEWQGVALRPVQLVPAALLPVALAMPRFFAVSRRLQLHFLALLWMMYMAGRFLLLAPTDPLTAMRAFTCIATFFTAMELSIRQRYPSAVLLGLVAGCLTSVAVSAADISIFGVEPRYYGSARWTGWMPGPNRFADLSGIASVICFAMVIQQSRTSSRYAWALALAACIGGVLASGSRGGLLATAIAIMATIWISGKVQSRRVRLSTYLKPIAWLCVLGGATLYFFGGHVSERVLEFVTLSSVGRANVKDDPRRDIAAATFKKFQKSPLVGGGSEYVAFDGGEIASHNSYLFLLSTSGLIGFGLYAVFIIVLVRRLWKIVGQRSAPVEIRALTTTALAGLFFLLVHMCVIDLVLSAHAWAFFGFAAAVAVRCSEPAARPAVPRRIKICG